MARPSTPPAIVVGFETNGLGVARALARLRISCIGVGGPEWNCARYTRTATVFRSRLWEESAVVEKLIEIGRTLPAKSPLLITKDEPVLWISSARRELEPFYEFALPDESVVQLLMSKLCFLERAAAKGWPMPGSWLVNSEAELAGCLDRITLPCILKPVNKNHAFRMHSPLKAFKVHTREELQAIYSMVSQWEPEVLVQEWIAGGDDRVVYCLGYWNRSGKALALFPGMKLRQWPPECGNTALAAPVSNPLKDRLLKLTGEILGEFAYRGLGSVEFKLREDGSPVIMEPTVGRTNYQNEIAVLNGINLPAIAYFDLLGRQDMIGRLVNSNSPRKPMKLIDGPAEKKAAQFYIRNGSLTASQWRESRSGPKKDMLFRWTDPAPFLAFRGRSAASFLKHNVLNSLKQRIVGGTHPSTKDPDHGGLA